MGLGCRWRPVQFDVQQRASRRYRLQLLCRGPVSETNNGQNDLTIVCESGIVGGVAKCFGARR